MLEVCKKCIEIFELFKATENILENVSLSEIALPPRGCYNFHRCHSRHCVAHYFLCFAPSVGMRILTCCNTSAARAWLRQICIAVFVCAKSVVQDPLRETLSFGKHCNKPNAFSTILLFKALHRHFSLREHCVPEFDFTTHQIVRIHVCEKPQTGFHLICVMLNLQSKPHTLRARTYARRAPHTTQATQNHDTTHTGNNATITDIDTNISSSSSHSRHSNSRAEQDEHFY